MNHFLVLCMASVVGVFTIAQSVALASIFDYYFYLLPFGMALAGIFLTAGMKGLSLVSINTRMVQTLPLFGAAAMLVCVAVYMYGASAGASLFFLSLTIVQIVAYVSFWSAIAHENWHVAPAVGGAIGVALGYIFTGYLNMDPLAIILVACVFSAALYVAQFMTRMKGIAYLFIVSLVALALFGVKPYHVMPASLGWVLDQGKAGLDGVNRNAVEKIWGPAGLSEMYSLDERAAWLYTNGSSPGLVLMGDLGRYDDVWWTQSAPLAMAIHDAVQPDSIVDIGAVPSDMVWRTISQGERNIYGLYGSRDWSLLAAPGLASVRKSVVLLRQPRLSMEEKVTLPVDMVVLSSGHAGKGGWVSSSGGEQTFLNQENILSYWKGLDEDGVLVLLARQESVFLSQFFGVWTALNNFGMSDTEFLDRAWGLVPDAAASESPYRYALVITKTARDEKFAQAIRSQVLKLPVRYLFGYGIPPSQPYNVLYQNDRGRVKEIFSQAASRMFGKYVSFKTTDSHKSIPYQFVEDVFPQYKNMLVLSVGVLIWIILFPLQKFRRVESIQTLQGPSIAVWMVTGGAMGILMVVSLAFLMVYPSSIPQEFRLFYLVILLIVAAVMYPYKRLVSQTVLVLAFASALVLTIYLTNLTPIIEDQSRLYVGVAGVVFVLLGASLPVVQSSLMRQSTGLVGWWWFAMAAGCAAALFWSMRLYSVLGDALFLIAGVVLMCIAGVLWWYGNPKISELRGGSGVATPVP